MEQGQSRLNKTLAIAAVVVALVLGLFFGSAIDIGRRLFGGPKPETVASSALQSMRAQNRLVPFVARYVSVVSSRQERLGGLVSSERTLILPGDVRYELDLAQARPEDVQWDAGSSTLSVTVAGNRDRRARGRSRAAREYGENGVLSVDTDADARSTATTGAGGHGPAQAGRCAGADAACARGGRQAVERSFALPLQAAGFDNAKVIARYPTEGSPVTEPLDRSRSYNDVLEEARKR